MIDFSTSEISTYYRERVPALKQVNQRHWRGKCPVHSGQDLNFAVDSQTGSAYCHSQCGRGWDLLGLEMEISRCTFPASKKAVFALLGRPEPSREDMDVVASYDYTDEHGQLVYQVLRKFPKRFVQRRPGPDGKWIYSLNGVARVPFRLGGFSSHQTIVLCEGEKDVVNLSRIGVFASCNSGGAESWSPEITQYFAEKQVIIFPDNDEPGRRHAIIAAKELYPVASKVRIAEIPGLTPKGDVSDFLASGGTRDHLKGFVKDSVDYVPGWEFPSLTANEEDKWVFTPSQIVKRFSSVEIFWDLASQRGIPTPFAELNDALGGGLRNGEVYLLGAERGLGKTSMMLQFVSTASKLGFAGMIFSLEMNDEDLLRRLVSIEERIDLAQLRILQRKHNEKSITLADDMLLNQLMRRLVTSTNRISTKYKVKVHQKPRANPRYLIEESQRMAEQQKIDYIVVDHMQLMAGDGSERGDYEKFTSISRALKGDVARELHIPLLVVSQVTRNNSREMRAELELTDLRGSGALEEDAAVVGLLYHDAEDVAKLKAAGELSKGPVKSFLKLGKNRFGPSGVYIELMHYKGYTRFESFDSRDVETQESSQKEFSAA